MLDFERKMKWYPVYLLSAALHEAVVGIQGAPLNCILDFLSRTLEGYESLY
jgi:hypothetical protein